jgi:hypothetical protein
VSPTTTPALPSPVSAGPRLARRSAAAHGKLSTAGVSRSTVGTWPQPPTAAATATPIPSARASRNLIRHLTSAPILLQPFPASSNPGGAM